MDRSQPLSHRSDDTRHQQPQQQQHHHHQSQQPQQQQHTPQLHHHQLQQRPQLHLAQHPTQSPHQQQQQHHHQQQQQQAHRHHSSHSTPQPQHLPAMSHSHFAMPTMHHSLAGMSYHPAQHQVLHQDPYASFVTSQAAPPQHAISPSAMKKRRLSDPSDQIPMAAPSSATSSAFADAESFLPSARDFDHPSTIPVIPPPPVKKSRTNTPWTPAEEHRLKVMRDAGNSWSEIAKSFPSRTEGSVKKHWYKDMHYAEFAEDESSALLAAIKEYEASKWKVIGQKLGKPAKACEAYAKEHFGGKI